MKASNNIIYSQNDILITLIKLITFVFLAYYTNYKISNKKIKEKNKLIIDSVLIVISACIYFWVKNNINNIIGTVSLVFTIALIFSLENIGMSIITTIVSLSINYILDVISIITIFFINKSLKINNDYINIVLIEIFHIIFLFMIFKIKKLKYGFSFLKKDEYNNILVLNISSIILFIVIIMMNSSVIFIMNTLPITLIFSIIMFITIQKSLQLYYKQKLLVQELEETKKELENKKEELQNVEKENINISKKNHTLAHKQKSLEHKIEEMINKSEVSKEEAEELKRRLKEIGKDLYKEKETIELDKTGIPEIDDMMKYMQSECKKNKIELEYQLKGNIYYMTNNLVSKEDLETLLADHIKNAIIAINHTNNLNRSILVRLGKIDENYGLYIYDSGIEFKPEIFEKLGKEPSTTHPDEGGTGMGFMNTFDTLRKYNASLTIEEYNKPNKDNYTKVLIIKFDGKKEFKIKSYQLKETIKIG